MIKDISQRRYKLFEVLGMCVLLSCTILGAYQKPEETKPVEVTKEISETDKVVYITDKQLERLYSCRSEEINDTCLVLSVEDAEILMKVAVLEDSTDEISQAYVMSIILNRVNSPDFPNTIREVVEQKGQFLKLTDKRYLNASPDVNSHLALAKIESKEIQTDFLFYEALWVENSWASKHRELSLEYGGSRFYK